MCIVAFFVRSVVVWFKGLFRTNEVNISSLTSVRFDVVFLNLTNVPSIVDVTAG